MTKLLVASRNAKKLAELRRVLDAAGLSGVTLVSLNDVAPFDEAPETGATFEENALIKAREAFSATGLPSVADDSGRLAAVLQRLGDEGPIPRHPQQSGHRRGRPQAVQRRSRNARHPDPGEVAHRQRGDRVLPGKRGR